MEKNGLEVIGRGAWVVWGWVWGYPRGDRKFLDNFPMILGKFSEISWVSRNESGH